MVSPKVGPKMNLDTYLQHHYTKHKDHPSIRKFPIQEAITDSLTAFNKVKTCKESIDNWVNPLNFADVRDGMMATVQEFFDKVEEASSYQETLIGVKKSVSAQAEGKRRNWRNHRNKVSELLANTIHKICVMMKIAGDIVLSLFESPEDAGISTEYTHEELTPPGSAPAEMFATPKLVLPLKDVASEQQTHWHIECDALISNNRTAFMDKSEQAKPGIKKGDLVVGRGCIDVQKGFDWNMAGQKLFEPVITSTKTIVYTQQVCACTLAAKHHPYQRLAGFLHAISGTMVVVVLSADQVTQNPDVETWLSKLHAPALSKAPVFLLKAGSSLWVPFCHCAVVLGIPQDALNPKEDDKEKGKKQATAVEFETVTYAHTLLFDTASYKADPSQQLSVASFLVQSAPHHFKWTKDEKIKAWRVKLEQASSGQASSQD